MNKRSPEGVAEEWRKQGFSGQIICRSSIGAAFREVRFVFSEIQNCIATEPTPRQTSRGTTKEPS